MLAESRKDMMKHYQFGRLPFAITVGNTDAGNSIAPHVREELQSVESSNTQGAILEFDFAGRVASPAEATILPPYEIGKNSILGQSGGLTFRYEKHPDTARLQVAPIQGKTRLLQRFPLSVQRFKDWNYLSVDEQLAKNFMYGLFDSITQVTQLPLGQSHLHASAMERDGQAVVVAGWGGIGKTTTILKLITEDGWNYLSDDLGVVDADGFVYRTPKRMQVYAYNLAGEPLLREKLLGNRSFADRLSWKCHFAKNGPKKVRRRVSAEQLFGPNSCGTKATIARLLMIERSSEDHFVRTPLTREEFSSRATSTLIHELSSFVPMSSASHTAGNTGLFPSIQDYFEQTYQVLLRAVANVEPVLIRIPKLAKPAELADYMRKEIEDIS